MVRSSGAATQRPGARGAPVERDRVAAPGGARRVIPGSPARRAYVCGSRKEEFGLAIVEALAAGLPVVVPADRWPRHVCPDGVTGVIVDTTIPSAIADGLARALDHGRRPGPRPPSRSTWSTIASRSRRWRGRWRRSTPGTRRGGVAATGHACPSRESVVPGPALAMTLLVISPDYASHLLPLATLATAWADRGERVVVASGPAVAPIVAGFGTRRRRSSWAGAPTRASSGPRTSPLARTTSLRGFFAATRQGMVATLAYQAGGTRRRPALGTPEATAEAVLRTIDAVRPDTIVVDHLAFSATLALRAARIPFADVVLGHPSALPARGRGVRRGDSLAARPCDRQPEAVAALRSHVPGRSRPVHGDLQPSVLRSIDPAAPAVADAFAAHGPTVLYNYPEALHDPARTGTSLPERHAFLGSLVRPEDAVAAGGGLAGGRRSPAAGLRIVRQFPVGAGGRAGDRDRRPSRRPRSGRARARLGKPPAISGATPPTGSSGRTCRRSRSWRRPPPRSRTPGTTA